MAKITIAHLKNLKREKLIWLTKLKTHDGAIRFYVKKGPKSTQYRWRMIISDLKLTGFIHIGGSNPWMCDFKDGKWRPLFKN